MSSLIDASDKLGQESEDFEAEEGIIHFDATQRRKAKMRQKSQDGPAAGNGHASKRPAAELPKPAPVPQPPVATKPQPPATKPAATLDAYASAPKAPATSEAATLQQLSGAELEQFLIDFVVEQTGYPPEMVDLEADLEADLGIDSIKKAQLFGELAERFEIQIDVTDSELSLDDFPTLAHVMQFLENHTGDAAEPKSVSAPVATPPVEPVAKPAVVAPQSPAATPPQPAATPATANIDWEPFLIDFVVEQTGYPPEMVELDADLEADLGIDSIKKAQLFGELAEQFEISVDVTDESLSLDDFPTLRHVMDFLQNSLGSSQPTATTSSVPSPAQTPPQPAAPIAPAPEPKPSATLASGNGHVAPAATEAASSPTGLSPAELETFLVNFVVEQTGYPPEMVELDADLEADLGIDSIKKAQMMGELAEQFEITVDVTDETLSLDDFPTLRHVCDFLAQPEAAR